MFPYIEHPQFPKKQNLRDPKNVEQKTERKSFSLEFQAFSFEKCRIERESQEEPMSKNMALLKWKKILLMFSSTSCPDLHF